MTVMILLLVALILLGCLMDSLSMILLVIPFLWPVLVEINGGLHKSTDRRWVAAAQAATPILILKKASGELFVDIPAIEMVLGQPTDEAVEDPDRISCRDRTVAAFAPPPRIPVDWKSVVEGKSAQVRQQPGDNRSVQKKNIN